MQICDITICKAQVAHIKQLLFSCIQIVNKINQLDGLKSGLDFYQNLMTKLSVEWAHLLYTSVRTFHRICENLMPFSHWKVSFAE